MDLPNQVMLHKFDVVLPKHLPFHIVNADFWSYLYVKVADLIVPWSNKFGTEVLFDFAHLQVVDVLAGNDVFLVVNFDSLYILEVLEIYNMRQWLPDFLNWKGEDVPVV